MYTRSLSPASYLGRRGRSAKRLQSPLLSALVQSRQGQVTAKVASHPQLHLQERLHSVLTIRPAGKSPDLRNVPDSADLSSLVDPLKYIQAYRNPGLRPVPRQRMFTNELLKDLMGNRLLRRKQVPRSPAHAKLAEHKGAALQGFDKPSIYSLSTRRLL